MTDSSTTALVKGIKYQSYKLIDDLLAACINSDNSSIYYAIERFDDISMLNTTDDETMIGQAKYYSNDFSINSSEIKKSIKNFFNLYIKFISDENLSFCFYTSAGFHNEQSTAIITQEEIDTLKNNDTCFLNILALKQHRDYPDLVNNVIGRIIDGPENFDKNIEYIPSFLDKISWKYGVCSLDEIKSNALSKIRELDYYNFNFEGKEEMIFNNLVQNIEVLSLGKNSLSASLTSKDVEIMFLKLKSQDYKVYDDASKEFSLLKINDSRNIETKILEVCQIDDEKYFQILNQRITRGKADHSKISEDNSKTFLYRIYEICEEKLIDIIQSKLSEDKEYTNEIINDIIDELCKVANEHIADRKTDFKYALNSKDSIKNTILILFNECYLDFIKMD